MLATAAPDDLVPRATRGDAAARAELVALYGGRVFALCKRLAPDPEDCYQEVWEKVLGALPRFDPGGRAPIGAWIQIIARRHLTDRHRRRVVRGEVVPIDGLQAVDPGPDEALAKHQRRARLEAAIRRLPEAQRRVVVLHHIHGMPLLDIAREDGVEIGTLKSRLHRGRARLATLLRGHR